MNKMMDIEENTAYWQEEFEKLQKKYVQQQEEFSKLQETNNTLQEEKENISENLEQEQKKSAKLEERLESQMQMTKMTSEYLTKVSEDEQKQREEIQVKNAELENKNEEIQQQRESLEKVLNKLQQSHDEMKMQKEYLEATFIDLQNSHDEVEMQKNYLLSTVDELEKSHEKVEKQKSQLEITLKALNKKTEEVEEQNKLIEGAFAELDQAYADITASINYAKRIQQAMLPKQSLFEKYFAEHFILFKPRDVVSGDFYWITRLGNKIIVAAADCTGHGVPGSLVSMIGINLLDDIVNNKQITSPDIILQMLDKKIQLALDQKEGNNKDGMDIALCVVDTKENILSYAGAHNPILIIQDGTPTVFKGSKIGIGGTEGNALQNPFIKQEMKIHPAQATSFYIYSDGYQDQFGGPEDRKFMSRRFRKLIIEKSGQTMQTQKKELSKIFENWKAGYSQLDDVLVMGLKIY